MNKTRDIAERLNGLGYPEQPNVHIVKEAKEHGVVIIYGASDDLMEIRGAVDEEIGCFDGGTVLFTSKGLVKNKCDNDDCPYFLKEKEGGITVEALWCEEADYSWTYKTDIPHETFEVEEDGEPYCRGIVFKLSDVNVTTKRR